MFGVHLMVKIELLGYEEWTVKSLESPILNVLLYIFVFDIEGAYIEVYDSIKCLYSC